MLRRVECTNFSLLRDVRVELTPGLTVLTGASGAGKTLLFDAVSFALGARASRGLLPDGASSGQVKLVLELPEDVLVGRAAVPVHLPGQAGPPVPPPWQPGENVIVRRISATGAGRITLNGAAVSAAQVQALAERYIEITGQFESRVLFDSRSHLGLLESFGSGDGPSPTSVGGQRPPLLAARDDYRAAFERHSRVAAALAALHESSSSRAQELDFLSFQVEELSKASVLPGERARVESALKLQQNAQELVLAASTAAQLLSGEDEHRGAYDLAASALTHIDTLVRLLGDAPIAELDPQALRAQGADAIELLADLAGQLRSFAQSVQYDAAQEAALSERIDEVLRLERKYGVMADELTALLDAKHERLTVLTDATQSPAALERELAELAARLESCAGKLTKQRQAAAKRLVAEAQKYLSRLDFPEVQFEVDIRAAGRMRADGADAVEFLVSLNPGEPPRALAQVASGGEASRLFLALKAALADRLDTRVMLLDEVEAGLGGDTAKKVAEVLKELSGAGLQSGEDKAGLKTRPTGPQRQILAITHLPVVAARGETHLLVSKEVRAERSSVSIAPVSGAARKAELVRMLGGDSKEARALVERMSLQ